MDYMERLRRLAVSDAGFAEDCLSGCSVDSPGLDAKTLPCAVAAAPKLALALGYDTDDE